MISFCLLGDDHCLNLCFCCAPCQYCFVDLQRILYVSHCYSRKLVLKYLLIIYFHNQFNRKYIDWFTIIFLLCFRNSYIIYYIIFCLPIFSRILSISFFFLLISTFVFCFFQTTYYYDLNPKTKISR